MNFVLFVNHNHEIPSLQEVEKMVLKYILFSVKDYKPYHWINLLKQDGKTQKKKAIILILKSI
jgi:hypothetical protein